jgi:ribosomal protein S12 methylthiotransferase accessory factor
LTLYRKKDFLRGSPDDLKNKKIPALDLNLLVGFSEEQKKDNPKLRFNGESVFCWEKAKRFSTGETIYLPAQTIYWTYQNDYEPLLGETNTNGAGGWFTEEGAILSGIYEIIQRDSFLIYWLNELTPKTVDPETVPDEDFQSLLAESKRYGFEIYCLNITADTGVPAFAVVISDSSGKGPRFCLGAGCQANPARALHRALEEAWSVYYWIRPLPPFSALDESYQPFKEKRIKQDERLRLWANPEMADRFKFLISGKKESFADIDFNYPKEFASQKEELDFLVKRIEKLGSGYEVYYFLPQHSVLSEIGYYSAQVIIPRFMPLYIFEIDIPLNSPRLKEVPPKLGLKAAKNINPLPHPFP